MKYNFALNNYIYNGKVLLFIFYMHGALLIIFVTINCNVFEKLDELLSF